MAVTGTQWDKLRELTHKLKAMTAVGAQPLEPKPVLHGADAIVIHIEVCGRHGVGRHVQMSRNSAISLYGYPTRTRAGTPCSAAC